MNNMSFVKGMGLGIMLGSVVGMVVVPKKKKFNIGKALKSMGDVVDNIADSIGL